MWGRLDAAEVIIDTLLAKDDPRRDALRVQRPRGDPAPGAAGRGARRASSGRVGGLEAADDAALVKAFRDWFKEPGPLEPSKVDGLTARSLRIGGGVLADAAYGREVAERCRCAPPA